MKKGGVLVLDFGGQYNQLIARRIRECNVYCEVKAYNISPEAVKQGGYEAIVFTGGPSGVDTVDAPFCNKELFELGLPILGICYGAQMTAKMLDGVVVRPQNREYGKTAVTLQTNHPLFANITPSETCWMSHTLQVCKLPLNFLALAHTKDCPIAAFGNDERRIYGVQFHPEVSHTPFGMNMLRNFLHNICGLAPSWRMDAFVETAIAKIKRQVGSKHVFCALSGGVDSSVAAMLVHAAVGDQLTCLFIDHGLLRKDESDDVMRIFGGKFNLNVVRVDARNRFLDALAGVTDPERKRKIIGEEFIRVFEDEARLVADCEYLVQGTIYPDVIESGVGPSAVIKSHHNVGGLPEQFDLKLIEPLRNLFKDEVRLAGLELGIPEKLVFRQPFPGPGIAIRIIGDITAEKIALVQESDAILREEVANAGLDRQINQYFTVLTNTRSVGVMGDERTYDYTLAIRAVSTTDFMTADWFHMPYDVLECISNRIVNETPNINRIVYDVTSKPPATIEWE